MSGLEEVGCTTVHAAQLSVGGAMKEMSKENEDHIVSTRCGKLTSFFELSGLKEKGS
jgi:hypothetical protein